MLHAEHPNAPSVAPGEIFNVVNEFFSLFLLFLPKLESPPSFQGSNLFFLELHLDLFPFFQNITSDNAKFSKSTLPI